MVCPKIFDLITLIVIFGIIPRNIRDSHVGLCFICIMERSVNDSSTQGERLAQEQLHPVLSLGVTSAHMSDAVWMMN